jgi:hypothetical protein
LDTDLGYPLMRVVLLAVLEQLMARSITALVLHDGLLVPRSEAKCARSVMMATASQVTEASIPVSIDQE